MFQFRPYEATKSFEAAENRLLKRFEIQIEKPENFQGIDVSRMLEHIGKSFPILEEFTVHLLDRSRTVVLRTACSSDSVLFSTKQSLPRETLERRTISLRRS